MLCFSYEVLFNPFMWHFPWTLQHLNYVWCLHERHEEVFIGKLNDLFLIGFYSTLGAKITEISRETLVSAVLNESCKQVVGHFNNCACSSMVEKNWKVVAVMTVTQFQNWSPQRKCWEPEWILTHSFLTCCSCMAIKVFSTLILSYLAQGTDLEGSML